MSWLYLWTRKNTPRTWSVLGEQRVSYSCRRTDICSLFEPCISDKGHCGMESLGMLEDIQSEHCAGKSFT